MVTLNQTEQFAYLHRGGALAGCPPEGVITPLKAPNGDLRRANGADYLVAIEEHLGGVLPLGVYPLFKTDRVWQVHWMAVDLDEGEASLTHACNLRTLLERYGITGIIERSRRKGYHVWVYLKEPVSASVARRSMIGACRIVDVPIREVYPKQTELSDGGIGNCLRLPYPMPRTEGRQVALDRDLDPLDFPNFITLASTTMTTPSQVRNLLPLHVATQPASAMRQQRGARTDTDFTGSALRIWNATEWGDRSRDLCTFAMSLFSQGYTTDAVRQLLYQLDDRMKKYVGRSDRERRIDDIVVEAGRRI